jgi:hypothetical protein
VHRVSGFRQSDEIRGWLQDHIVAKVLSSVQSYYSDDSKRVCDDAGTSITVTLDQLVAGSSRFGTVLEANDVCPGKNIHFDEPLSISGNIAGGCGAGRVYTDARWVEGSIDVSIDCSGTIRLTPKLTFNVQDTVDFLVYGDLGPSAEELVTVPLAMLERYGLAHEVPFQVRFQVKSKDISPDGALFIGHVSPCNAPDPCDAPKAYRQWLATCGEGSTNATADCGSHDPNDIQGPTGYGEQGWIHEATALDYMVRFENDATLASAPAGLVTVTEQLDSDLDWRSFRHGTINFGTHTITACQGLASYEGRLDLRSELGIFVDVSAGVDASTGQVHWELKAIDPDTGQLPTNPLLGFLPQNRNGVEGLGYLTYTVQPRSGFITGTRIDARAQVVFDFNDPISTPAISNTYDVDGPSSAVASLPPAVGPGFLVQWSGTDSGAGIRSYDVYVSDNGGPYTLWRGNTLDTGLFPNSGDTAMGLG